SRPPYYFPSSAFLTRLPPPISTLFPYTTLFRSLLSFHPFGPTLGSAANITLMSYEDRCHIGVNTDRGAVPDPGLFRACLEEGFDEVLAVATAVATAVV